MLKKFLFSPNAAMAGLAVIAIIAVFIFLQAQYPASENSRKQKTIEYPTPAENDLQKANAGPQDPIAAEKTEDEKFLKSKEDILSVKEDDHMRGSGSAKVIMVVYSDFECPFCAKFSETIEQARKRFKDDLAVIYRHYPLEFHLNAFPAAIAAECAADQGKFWEMHDGLMKISREDSLTKDGMKNLAASIGIDQKKFVDCFDSFAHKEDIAKEMAEAKYAAVEGAPHFFLNSKGYDGAYPLEDFERDGEKVKGLQNLIYEELDRMRQ